MDPVVVAYLQGLVKDRPVRRRVCNAGQHLIIEYELGVKIRQTIHYRPQDHEKALKVLLNHDLPVERLESDAQRADAAAFGGLSEKTGTRAPHEDSVALRTIGACTFNGLPFGGPPGAYLVMTVQEALAIECDVLCVVENLETFRCLGDYGWVDAKGLRVLVVYRGDNRFLSADAVRLIMARKEPLWAMVDFDPAGLGIAATLPQQRLERLLWPEAEWLRASANSNQGRALFAQQVGQWGAVLDQTHSQPIAEAWQLLKSLGAGVTQERMRAARSQVPHRLEELS